MDFVTASLAYDCEGIPLKLKQPQIVEVAKMKHPIEFPLKGRYEEANTKLEGLAKGKLLDQRAEVGDKEAKDEWNPCLDDYEPDSEDDDDNDKKGPDPDGGKQSSGDARAPSEALFPRIDEIFDADVLEGMEIPSAPPAPAPRDLPAVEYEHYKEGKAGDGKVVPRQ